MGIGGKLLVSRKNIVVSKDSIGIDKDLIKDRNLNTFKMYCKRRKSSARFPDRKARNRLCVCHCIAGNVKIKMGTQWAPVHISMLGDSHVIAYGDVREVRRKCCSCLLRLRDWLLARIAGLKVCTKRSTKPLVEGW